MAPAFGDLAQVVMEPGAGIGADGKKGEAVAMMWWYGGNWMWWQATLGWVAMIVILGLLVWGIYALAKSFSRRPETGERGSDAGRILDERLARGDIDVEEYQRLRDLIAPDRAHAR